MRLSLLHCQSGTIVEDIALHLLDLLSDLFAISEKEKMRDIYFVKRATRTAKFPGKISVFPLFFCLSKEPQMSESFLQMVSTFLLPLLEEESSLIEVHSVWSRCLAHFTSWHKFFDIETKCRKFQNFKIKGRFAEKIPEQRKGRKWRYSKLIGKLGTAHFHNRILLFPLPRNLQKEIEIKYQSPQQKFAKLFV